MEDLERRMRENANIDSSVAVAASRLQHVARLQQSAARMDAPSLVMDLGDGALTPPRPSRSAGEKVASPLSPAVRAATSASAARRARNGAMRVTPPREAFRTDDNPRPSTITLVDNAKIGSGSGIPRLRSRKDVTSTGASSRNAVAADSAADAVEGVHSDLPVDSQISLLKSQVRMARKENQESSKTISELRTELTECQRALAVAADEKARLLKAVSAAETGLEKAKRAAAATETREAEFRNQIANLQRELAAANRSAKTEAPAGLEVRLNRALEEVDRLKAELAASKAANIETEKSSKEGLSAAASAIKKLERQRADLVLAFKKQLKLIDILKRQRIHMEAARMLAFTEDEFAKLMDSSST